MKNKYFVLLLPLLLTSAALLAQTNDFGLWTSVGAEKKIKKWNIGTEAELRTKDNVGQVDRWSLQADFSYDIFKFLRLGASYQFIYFYDSKYADFQPRSRYIAYIQGKQKINNFTFTLRERIQRTTKDDRDRIKDDGTIDTYKISPDWTWRNRLKVSYNIPKFPITPSFAFESFYELNNPDGNVFDKLRYTLAFGYSVKKHHNIELYGLIDKDINVDDPVQTFVAGLGYTYSF